MKTAIYLRVSTDDQRLDLQRDAAAAYLKIHPSPHPTEEYVDQLSGSDDARPGFQKLLQDVRAGLISTVLVYKLDRLSRRSLTALETILELDRLCVPFISVTQPMFSHGTPFRHAIIAIFAELAEMERAQLVERTRAGMAAAKARGARFGQKVRVNPDNMAQVIALRRQGLSFGRIAAQTGLSPSTAHRVAHGYRGPAQALPLSNRP